MIYVNFNTEGAVTSVTATRLDARSQCRVQWKTFEVAASMAEAATRVTGKLHIATDSGPCVSPRYDVIQAPAVGDEVSYAFNGDSYPCGTIKTISTSLRRIKTTDGTEFWRKGSTGAWIYDGTWYLVRGHENRRNPEF